MTMKAYYIYSPSSTFGQTEAGEHVARGQEEILASVDVYKSTEEEAANFIRATGMKLVFTLGDQGDQWGEMFPRVEIPVEPGREGLIAAAKVATKRRPSDPWLTVRDGRCKLVFSQEAPELRGPETTFDPANLAYQRSLLGR